MACHAINSVAEQRYYCGVYGILPPPTNLNMWLTNANSNGTSLTAVASTPMLKQMAANNLVAEVAAFYLLTTGHPLWAVAAVVLQYYPPDITYNYSENEDFYKYSDVISGIFYHELCHASHYSKVGSSYWLPYDLFILAHLGYGSNTDAGYGRVAISEAWAYSAAPKMTHQRYGIPTSIGESWLNRIEKYKPFVGTSEFTENYIPEGLMYDLTDGIGEMTPNGVVDLVSNYTLANCYNALDQDIVSVSAYKERFLAENGTSQYVPIIKLFESYGY